MPFIDITPNYTAAARCYVRNLINLDYPGLPTEAQAAADELIGFGRGIRTYASTDYPVTWRTFFSPGVLVVVLSGVRTTYAFTQLVRGYLYPTRPYTERSDNEQVKVWADQIWREIGSLGTRENPKVIIAGHSLGGLIGLALAKMLATMAHTPTVYLGTFGMPKSSGRPPAPPSNLFFSRWTNPEDNVPSLPPLPGEAQQLYALLNRTVRTNLSTWRHQALACSVTDTGALSYIEDPPSRTLTVSNLTQALQSVNGIFGPGHALSVYRRNLDLAVTVYTNPPQPATPPPPVGSLPTPPLPALVNVPRSNPAPVDNAMLDQRRIEFREVAQNNDSIPVDIPFPNLMKVERVGKDWYVNWMGYTISWAPTKKKARALCRHCNRFLRIFQGVASVESPAFVYALGAYLTAAAAPGGAFQPRLNDSGNPYVF